MTDTAFNSSTAEIRYAVGFLTPYGAELEAIPPEYRKECQSIRVLGEGHSEFCATVDGAISLRQSTIDNNPPKTVAMYLGGGPDALLILEVTPVYPNHPSGHPWRSVCSRVFNPNRAAA